jgi:hypothetical protein
LEQEEEERSISRSRRYLATSTPRGRTRDIDGTESKQEGGSKHSEGGSPGGGCGFFLPCPLSFPLLSGSSLAREVGCGRGERGKNHESNNRGLKAEANREKSLFYCNIKSDLLI